MKSKAALLVILLMIIFFSTAVLAETKVATDPTRIGVGARLLGMGKGYAGMADDLAGIFINPAALSYVSNLQVTSMSGKFINEYDYLQLGAAYPTPYGTFGVGYVGGSIGFTGPAATTEVIDGVRIIPSTTEGVSYGFNNRVFLFSWGNKLGLLRQWQWLDYDFIDDFSAGATLKFFSLDMSGPGITNGTASGNELDLGLHYIHSPMLRAGMVLQNGLPFSAGGKITWANKTEETLQSTLKLGLSWRVIGEEGFRQVDVHEVVLNIDRDIFPNRPDVPGLWHIGLEWTPFPILDIRLGVDQETVGTGTAGYLKASDNLTLGVGFYWSDFRFDYAFHQYSNVAENNTHYFSLAYGIPRKLPTEEVIKMASFSINPPDKSILFEEEVEIKGRALNEKIKQVVINTQAVPLDGIEFGASFPLRPRKNSFVVQGYDARERLVDSQKIRILKLKKFEDVAADYWAAVPISILAMEGLISGYPDGTFKPEGNITRAEMCTLLMKAKGGEAVKPESLIFGDVSTEHWAAPYISQAVEQEVVKGYPDNTFRPNGDITRAEGVTILARLVDLPEPRLVEIPFSDVPGRHWAVKFVSSAKEAGILKYLADKPFEPNRKLTRAEVAEMLSKTDLISDAVSEYLDWAKGY